MELTKPRLKQLIKETIGEVGPLVYFQVFKIPDSNEFRVARNRKEQRQWGYEFEQLPEDSHWKAVIEKLMRNEGEPEYFPEGEWRDIHYTPFDGLVKHFRRGLPYIPYKQ